MTFIKLIREANGKRMLIGGHRGHLSSTRENTINNFEELLRTGIEYIEIDVQLTKDDHAVIFHDQTLEQATSLTGNIRNHTVAELKKAFDICTLDEAVSWCKANGMYLLLEIKSNALSLKDEQTKLVHCIVDSLKKNAYVDGCIVLGVNQYMVHAIKQLIPEVTTALIVPRIPENPVGLVKQIGADIYLSFIEDLSDAVVRKLHEAGIVVDGSVVNTPEQLKHAIDLNVDMIESDYPEAILEAYLQLTKGDVLCSAM